MNTSQLNQYGPWAVITGASDGIGKALAEELAASGLNLILVARRRPILEKLANQLCSKYNIDVRVIAEDLTQPSSLKAIEEITTGLDIGLLVAAAGFGSSGDFIDAYIEDELSIIDVNCRSVVQQCHYFAHRFKQRQHSGIILFSSIFAFQGVPGSANYAASKAFIQSFAEGIQAEFKSKNIDVLSAAYGPVNTGFADRANMVMKLAQSPENVARSTLASLGKKTTTRPGAISKLLGYSLSCLPRWARTKILSMVVADMTKHQLPRHAN